MEITTNSTTTRRGSCAATVILCTEAPSTSKRITTLELVYPRYIHCFDSKTEILARVGDAAPKFISFKKARALGAKVAQFDNGKISFVEPQAWIENSGTHRMVKYENKKFSMLVTDKHRILVNKRTTGNRFVPETWEASKLSSGEFCTFRIPQSGFFNAGQRYAKEELALMVWFAADGTKQKDRICFHFRKQRKVAAVELLLKALGIAYVKRTYDDSTCVWCDSPAWVDECYTDSGEKKLPEDGLFMDAEGWRFVKQAILESDGCALNREFNTTSVVFAEQVQVLAHLHGDAMNLRSYGQGRYKKLYKSKFKDSNYISFRRDKDRFESCEYEGTVHCVSVPSAYVMVRRDGIVYISGNCEFMTHRAFSRNAQSSRATPTKVLIQEVMTNPITPSVYYKNCKGMASKELLPADLADDARGTWLIAAHQMATAASVLHELGVHKQHVNRLLEPFLPIKVVVTATEWSNFFRLRLAQDAQPEIQMLAACMAEAMSKAEVHKSIFHIPYLTEEEQKDLDGYHAHVHKLMRISAARCARVSYYKHDGKRPTAEEDLELAERLEHDGHLTPFEHQAWEYGSAEQESANLRGWRSKRKLMETFNEQEVR